MSLWRAADLTLSLLLFGPDDVCDKNDTRWKDVTREIVKIGYKV